VIDIDYCHTGVHDAFHRVAKGHIGEMSKRGYKIREHNVREVIDKSSEVSSDTVLLHPFISLGIELEKLSRTLATLEHSAFVGVFEIADTDEIARQGITMLNRHDIVLIVPSTYSKQVYHRSGALIPVEVVPHGVSELYLKSPKEIQFKHSTIKKLREDERVKVLSIVPHSPERKGFDISLRAMRVVQRKWKDVVWVVKGPWGVPQGISVRGLMSDEDMIALYDICDVFLHPYRGGGFELCVLEALCRGTPVITTGAGAVLDYVSRRSAYLVPVVRWKKIRTGCPQVHIGLGFEPSLARTIDALEWVLNDLEYIQKKAREQSKKFKRLYSWERATDRLLFVIEKWRE